MSEINTPKKSMSFRHVVIGGVIVLVIMVSCSDKKEGSSEQRKTPDLPKLAPEEKIGESILQPYSKAQYPKTFAKFGGRMQDVEKARAAGAWLAAHSAKCAKVEMAEVSDKSTRKDIHVFVDCAGGQRFRFEEAELKDGKGHFYTKVTAALAPMNIPISERATSHDAALATCKQSVRSSAKFASTVDFDEEIVRTSQGSGETWVELHFKAMNGLGALLPYKAHCTFPLYGNSTIEISPR